MIGKGGKFIFMKRFWVILIFVVFAMFFLSSQVLGQENSVNVYFFWSKTCPHCAKMKPFLLEFMKSHPQAQLYAFEISTNYKNVQYMRQVGSILDADVTSVPFTVVGETTFSGWSDRNEAREKFASVVEQCIEVGCTDKLFETLPEGTQPVVFPTPTPQDASLKDTQKESQEKLDDDSTKEVSLVTLPVEISLPLVGAMQTRDLSLPVLTVVIGLLDGFNPCAMWVLLFLISLLLGIPSRSRRWVLGGAFLLASGFIYFVFLAAWLNLFLFLGWVFWLRIVVGFLAIGVGVIHLRSWYLKQTGCVVASHKKRQKVFQWIREVILRRSLVWSVVGIVLLAFAVNLVELVCSIALPAAYTQTLALNNLPSYQYYAYILLYLIVFMLDDFIVFVVAMVTLEAVGIEGKYSRFVALIGGILMLLIGLALVLKPELLRFGM